MESLEQRTFLAADITSVALGNDTGASTSDLITTDPTFSAYIEYDDFTYSSVDIEFDHDNDGSVDGYTTAYSSYTNFSYDPLTNDSSLNNHNGNLTLRYRTVEHDGGNSVTSGWSSFSFTLDRVAPTISSVTPAASTVLSSAPTKSTVTFNENIDTSYASATYVWVEDANNATTPAQSASGSGSSIDVTFTGTLPGGEYDTEVMGVADLAGNTLASSSTTNWRLTAAPTASTIPDVDVDEDSMNTDVSLSMYFSDEFDSSTALTYTVHANTNTDLFDSTSITSDTLTLDYAEDKHGDATITIRATDSDGLTVDASFDVDVASVNDAPVITSFIAVADGPDYEFTGEVEDDDAVPGLTITFGGALSGHSTTVKTDGTFEYKTAISSGNVTAQTTDNGGLDSNEASYYV